MHDHLWPARVEYVRAQTPLVERGQPATALRAPEVEGRGHYVHLFDHTRVRGAHGYVPLSRLHLDLRDVTARAHAAMAWTEVDPDGRARIKWAWRFLADEAPKHVETLRRMRSLSEIVTVEEARAALAWAEGVSVRVKSAPEAAFQTAEYDWIDPDDPSGDILWRARRCRVCRVIGPFAPNSPVRHKQGCPTA